MLIVLNTEEADLLAKGKIQYFAGMNYSDDEAFQLLEKVYAAEASYSDGNRDLVLAKRYAQIADKIQSQIPEA